MEKKRKYLINFLQKYLETSVALIEYYKSVAKTRKEKYVCTKSIKSSLQAIDHLRQIKHIEILEYLYSTFVGNNVIAYSVSGKIVLSNKLNEYDSDNGIQEFREMVETQKKEREQKEKQRQETLNAVRKAKEQGKKVEMVWDKDTKTTKPMIVQEKVN